MSSGRRADLCGTAGMQGRGGGVDDVDQRRASHSSRQDPPHAPHRARPQARQIRHVRSHSKHAHLAHDMAHLFLQSYPALCVAVLLNNPLASLLLQTLRHSSSICRLRRNEPICWLRRNQPGNASGPWDSRLIDVACRCRVVEDYAVVFFGSAVFKISRLLFIAMMCAALIGGSDAHR
jgi:hypothetical protein